MIQWQIVILVNFVESSFSYTDVSIKLVKGKYSEIYERFIRGPISLIRLICAKTMEPEERVDLFSHDGLKRLWKDRAAAGKEKKKIGKCGLFPTAVR